MKKNRLVRLGRFSLPLLLIGALGVGCDDDDEPIGVTIADLAGTWVATSVVLSNNAFLPVDPFDLVAVGATVTLTIQNNGNFTFSATNLPAPLSDVNITGTIEITGNNTADIITDDPLDPAPAAFTLSGDNVTLSVPNAELIDFDESGTIEPAEEVDLSAAFTRQA